MPRFSDTVIAKATQKKSWETLQDAGVWLYGAAGEATQTLYETDLSGPLALLLGGEGKGLRRLTREHCDGLMSIPMAGSVSSLNVSVGRADIANKALSVAGADVLSSALSMLPPDISGIVVSYSVPSGLRSRTGQGSTSPPAVRAIATARKTRTTNTARPDAAHPARRTRDTASEPLATPNEMSACSVWSLPAARRCVLMMGTCAQASAYETRSHDWKFDEVVRLGRGGGGSCPMVSVPGLC